MTFGVQRLGIDPQIGVAGRAADAVGGQRVCADHHEANAMFREEFDDVACVGVKP